MSDFEQHEFNHILDAFKIISGSSHWPSSDPKDSPYDKFECRICGWTFEGLVAGSFNIGEDPYDWIKKRALEHLAFKHNIGTQLLRGIGYE